METALVLFAIARKPASTTEDLMDQTGLSQSSISRNTTSLGDWNRHDQVGHQMVECIRDPEEKRRMIYFLTAKGRNKVVSILQNLNPDFRLEHVSAKTWLSNYRRTKLKHTYRSDAHV